MTEKQQRIIDLCIEQLQRMKLSNDLRSPTVHLDMEHEWSNLGDELNDDFYQLDLNMFFILREIRGL